MNFFDNITFRKAKTLSMTENSSSTSPNSSKIDGSTCSLPNISNDEIDVEVQQLQSQIQQLNLQLNSAHEKIQNLNLENNSLKKTVHELTSKYDILIKATKKSTSEDGTPVKSAPTSSTPRIKSQKRNQKKHCNQLPSNENLETSKTPESRNQVNQISEIVNKPVKNKLCIVSANKINNITSIAEETFENLQVCHYIFPNCGILQLTDKIDKKLADFSMSDYCVILIGEKDFQQTENYVNIIIELRQSLLKIQHTNVILCVPTFRLSNYSTMFNWRIETFNNLLLLDIQTYAYATAFDSNLDLLYDFTMFSKVNRKINDRGMRNIFHNLRLTIFESSTECEALIHENINSVVVSPSREFFL